MKEDARILGIDYGERRIGVAISDPFGWTARGVETIYWKGDLDGPVERINHLAKEYGVNRIVVGFPINMNGTVGPRGEKTLEFICHMAEKTDREIIKWDERLSTVAANRTMHEMGIKTSKKKGMVDQIAAVHILQGYLDSIRLSKG